MKGMMCMRQINTFNCQKKRTSLLFYMIFIIAGVFIGALIAEKNSLSASVLINQKLYTNSFSWHDSTHTLVSLLIFLCAAYFTGLFVFGQACGIVLLMYRGIGIDASTGLMYIIHSESAIIPLILTFLPRATAAAFIAALAVRESVHNSKALLAFCVNSYDKGENSISFKLYCIRYIVLMIFSIFISVADGAIAYLYSSMHR